MPYEQLTEVHDIVQKAGIKTIPKEKKHKKVWLSEEALQIAVKRREPKSKGEKEKKMSRRSKQIFLQIRHADGQQSQEKMFNLAKHYKKSNENYNEILPHTSQKASSKIYKQ